MIVSRVERGAQVAAPDAPRYDLGADLSLVDRTLVTQMTNEQVNIILNGEPATVPTGTSLTGLIQILGLNPGQVAIEVNRRIIKREQWNGCLLSSGDQVEVVHFVGGG